MMDEGLLAAALREAADSVEVDGDNARRILSEARSTGVDSPRTGIRPSQRRAVPVLVGAAALLVVAAISWPLLRSEGGVRVASGLHKASGAPLYRPTGQGAVTVTGSGFSSPEQAPRGSSKKGVQSSGATSAGGPRIESRGSVQLRVAPGKVSSTLTALGKVAKGDGGSTLSTQARVNNGTSGHFASGTIVLQAPQTTFAKLVGQVQRLGRTLSVSTTSTDVTSQYVDLSARISAAQATRSQYLSIMVRATTIGEVLAVQQRLDGIQSQIEQLQGQLSLLNHQTTDGTLTVNVSTSAATSPVVHHRSGLDKAFHDAVNGFVAGVEWMIRLSGPVLFAALLLGTLLVLSRWIWRLRR